MNYKQYYRSSKLRWLFLKFLVRVLGVQAELDQAIIEHNNAAIRHGQWKAFDRVLFLLNTYEKREVLKKDLYRDIMNLRPE